MGVGKGTVARALVKETNYFAIDTDDLIESVENRTVKKIFQESKEAYFREVEKKCSLWLEKCVDHTIISTGGGFYKQENLHKIGTIVYLESSFEGILNRIHAAPNAKSKLRKRPLLSNLEEAKKLYNQRIEEYKRVCDVTVNVENREMEDIIKELLGKIS